MLSLQANIVPVWKKFLRTFPVWSWSLPGTEFPVRLQLGMQSKEANKKMRWYVFEPALHRSSSASTFPPSPFRWKRSASIFTYRLGHFSLVIIIFTPLPPFCLFFSSCNSVTYTSWKRKRLFLPIAKCYASFQPSGNGFFTLPVSQPHMHVHTHNQVFVSWNHFPHRSWWPWEEFNKRSSTSIMRPRQNKQANFLGTCSCPNCHLTRKWWMQWSIWFSG